MTLENIPAQVAEYTEENIYKVPKNQWSKWNKASKQLFNYLYGYTLNNKGIICGTDIFGDSQQIQSILNATIWNMAWESASWLTKSMKTNRI